MLGTAAPKRWRERDFGADRREFYRVCNKRCVCALLHCRSASFTSLRQGQILCTEFVPISGAMALENVIEAIIAGNITSLNHVAFALTQPGTTPDEDALRAFVTLPAGDAADVSQGLLHRPGDWSSRRKPYMQRSSNSKWKGQMQNQRSFPSRSDVLACGLRTPSERHGA